VIVMFLFGIWIFNSVFAHSFLNIEAAAYTQFKKWEITTLNAPFLYHPEYLPILFELNIGEEHLEDFLNQTIDPDIIANVPEVRQWNISHSVAVLKQLQQTENLEPIVYVKIANSLNNIYKLIVRPNSELENTKNIYRAGTFLKYFITQNNSRLYEDSLLNNFDVYFYEQNKDATIQNMKDIGLSYILVDLNAATIDRDPARNLTKRTENMFELATSDKVELIEADSICLKLALDLYQQDNDLNKYMTLATVNHNSQYWLASEKASACHDVIYQIIEQQKVTAMQYNYLIPIASYLANNNVTKEIEIRGIIQRSVNQWYKALFKIK